jgi:hypothetical protein
MSCCKKKRAVASFQPSPGTGEDVKWHALQSVDEIHRHAGVSPHGLAEHEVEARLLRYGKNEMAPPSLKTFLRRLWEQVYNMLIIVSRNTGRCESAAASSHARLVLVERSSSQSVPWCPRHSKSGRT